MCLGSGGDDIGILSSVVNHLNVARVGAVVAPDLSCGPGRARSAQQVACPASSVSVEVEGALALWACQPSRRPWRIALLGLRSQRDAVFRSTWVHVRTSIMYRSVAESLPKAMPTRMVSSARMGSASQMEPSSRK